MRPTNTTVALLCVASLAFAGCMGLEPTTEIAPLEVTSSADEAEAGDTLRFQAEAPQAAPGGRFVFAFGDGENVTVEGDKTAEVEHSFADGGHYTVEVQLIVDDAPVATGSQEVHVRETQDLETVLVTSGPLANETSTAMWEVAADEDATSIEVELRADNQALIGQSLVYVALYDNGTLLDNKTVTLGEGGEETIILTAFLGGHGNLTLEATAESGSASVGGTSQVRFD